ncbi:WW domain containing adaptor with coiled-coil b isoform X2 [Ictalurus punctatus]|uniref:WW domain containing adaptor with coiled-coil b isoform X2 n=1 Tax=Ictalurus punctatus TaxID=7998 RepID=A0A9F7R431_ICTPU|nr:WW domain containing adaptor with coiled-coil b isoform X2 [Ictalurus punctatus]
MHGNSRDSLMGVTSEGIISLTRPSNTNPKVTLQTSTVMTSSTTHRTKLHRARCCGAPTVPTASEETETGEHLSHTEPKRAAPALLHTRTPSITAITAPTLTLSHPNVQKCSRVSRFPRGARVSFYPPPQRDPADDWSEHISSSGKKYYYNCRTEVSQWEKPKEWLEREQRQKEASKAVVVNSFPKDRDYRQEAMQAAAASAVTAMKPVPSEKASSHCGFSQASCSSSSGPNVSSAPGSSTSHSSSHSSALLQDPALLRQLLPALQATLHINNSSVDMAKINEVLTAAVTQASLQSMLHKLLTAGPSAFNITALLSQAAQLSTQAQQPSQSPISVTPDTSSPKSCLVSPRVSTPQTNSMASKPLSIASSLPSQIKVSESGGKSALQHSSEKTSDVEDPRLHRQNQGQGPQSSGPNGCLLNNSAPACPPTTFSPSLALHFNENLVRHVQSWPSDHVEKQAARLREDVHNMGSMNMSEICVELKKLRSLVRVCEIQATLREQRILFLRQEIKELEKLKNQNSFMV